MDILDIHPRRAWKNLTLCLSQPSNPKSLPVFLHVPKTGGTYISHTLAKGSLLSLNHCLLRKTLTDAYIPVGLVGTRWRPENRHIPFATVRNPLTFFRSYYHHVIGHGTHHNTNHYDYRNATRGFEFLMQCILNRTDCWPSRKFLFPQLFDESGILVAKWINKSENLDADLRAFSEKFGIPYIPADKKRSAPVSEMGHYFSDELAVDVLGHYGRECRLFGYKSDGSNNGTILHRDVRGVKATYFYHDDKLVL